MSGLAFTRAAGLAGLTVAMAACGARVPVATAGIPGNPTGIPRSGLEVIGAMRLAHPSRELHSLAFSVTTTPVVRDSGETRRERAHAQLPGRHRVAMVPESRASGTVRDRQRVSVFDRGRRVASRRQVDLAALLAYDLFAQSIDTTIMWLDSARVRFGLLRLAEWNGRKVWVVGAAEGDSSSAQFWVDAQRWRLVRVIQPDPHSPSRTDDMRFEAFTTLHDVPVPTRIVIFRDGRPALRKVMDDFVANPELPNRAFDLSRWRPLDD